MYRYSDPILRTRPLPLLPFLAPSIPARWLYPPNVCQQATSHVLHRTTHTSPFSTSTHQRAPKGQTKESKAPQSNKLDSLEDLDPRSDVDKILDRDIPKHSSAYSVRETYKVVRNKPGDFASKMRFPSQSNTDPQKASQDMMTELQERRPIAHRARRTVRSRPTVGRTIELNPVNGVDFGVGLRKLGQLVSREKIRADRYRQMFHERAGMKRKRLKSERWRKLFKEGFRATVARVKEMRRKGW